MADDKKKTTGGDKNENKDKNTEKNEKKAEGAAAAAPKAKNDILGDEVDPGDLILENERESIPLTPKNARFFRSSGGLISLELTHDDGERELFERVIILRAFPVTTPDEFLSVREPDSRKMGRAKEIGMIRYMSDFDEETGRLFLEELDRRYFSPELTKVNSVKEKFGYYYWDAVTSAGNMTFVLNNPFNNIRKLEDGRVLISDIDGNIFHIKDPKQLDTASYRKIEMYL